MKRIQMLAVSSACLVAAVLARPAFADEVDPAAQMPGGSAPSSSMSGQKDANTGSMTGQRDAKTVIAAWPDKTKSAAQALIEKYGQPDAVSDKMLGWNDKDQWSMVGVFRDSVAQNDPTAHEDFLENKISYVVPENKVGDLARFDHALVVDQIRGTLASHGDSEAHNMAALNLANEIVTGKRDVSSARSLLKKTMTETAAGKSSPYADKLMFSPSSTGSSTEPRMPSGPDTDNPQTPPMPY